MNNPSYRAYQEQTATLSLFPFVYVKYIPPVWGVATPSAPEPGATIENSGAKEQREWKRRIKMYRACVVLCESDDVGSDGILFCQLGLVLKRSDMNESCLARRLRVRRRRRRWLEIGTRLHGRQLLRSGWSRKRWTVYFRQTQKLCMEENEYIDFFVRMTINGSWAVT